MAPIEYGEIGISSVVIPNKYLGYICDRFINKCNQLDKIHVLTINFLITSSLEILVLVVDCWLEETAAVVVSTTNGVLVNGTVAVEK